MRYFHRDEGVEFRDGSKFVRRDGVVGGGGEYTSTMKTMLMGNTDYIVVDRTKHLTKVGGVWWVRGGFIGTQALY